MTELLEKNHFQGVVLRKELNLPYLWLHTFCLRRTRADGFFTSAENMVQQNISNPKLCFYILLN